MSFSFVQRIGACARLASILAALASVALSQPALNFSTYLGGSSFDAIYAIATDASGNLYITGETSSGSLTNAASPARSSRDVFVAKMNSTGTQLVYVVYLGGSEYDSGRAIAADASGNVYVTGVTGSSDFPVTSGALYSHWSGGDDAFVFKLDPTGHLLYSTYLGGEKDDSGSAIAVDASGNAYVAGETSSSLFPATADGFQRSNHGGLADCFVAKLNPATSALVYSTFLGGSGMDSCAGLTVDQAGNAYVTGTTYSVDFPTLGALQGSLLGTSNALAAKLGPAGSNLIYSTFLGGSGRDMGNAIAIDSSGSVYVAGSASSVDFPVTTAAVLKGTYNAFVTKLTTDGSALMYSTFVGGSGTDAAMSIAVDPAKRAVLGGYTTSPDFPLAGSAGTFQGAFDAFAAVLDSNANLIFSSYFGGSGDDKAYAVALSPGNVMNLAGSTSSSNFPVKAAVENSLNAGYHGFLLQENYASVTADSVTPSSGSGLTQNFMLQYSDSAGAASLASVWVGFGTSASYPAPSSCTVDYSPSTNTLNLENDSATAATAAVLGSAGTLQNSQCSLNMAGTAVGLSGNQLVLHLAVTFNSSFSGSKGISMWAADAGGTNSGWQSRGSWSIPAPAPPPPPVTGPSAVAVTPASGAGFTQTFALQYSDSAGAASLASVWVAFSNTASNPATNSCAVYYSPSINALYLENDTATGSSGAVLGSYRALQNSQCTVNPTTSTITLSGASLILNLAVTFNTAFSGAHSVYLRAIDGSGSNTGWQSRGTWTVGNAPVLTVTADSVTPGSGSGATQSFALQYSDSAGVASLATVWAGFGTSASYPAPSSCAVYYSRSANAVYLENDAATSTTSAVIGTRGILQNSQCSVNMAATSVSPNGNALTLTLAVTFNSSFSGSKSIYLCAVDTGGTNSGWQSRGSWTVPGSASPPPPPPVPPPATGPSAVSVLPGSGSGFTQAFALQYSDTAGASSLASVWVAFNATANNPASSSCAVYYNPSINALYLENDTATGSSGAVLGSYRALQNSQCTVNPTTSTVTLNGTTLILNLAVTFNSAFSGAQNIYLRAVDSVGSNTGWQSLGTWTVGNAPAVTVTAASVTPSSGSGATQSFTLEYSDSAGAASLATVWAAFGVSSSYPAPNTCSVYYSRSANAVYLENDAATSATSAAIGTSGALQNSQCSLNMAATTVSLNGNALVFTLAVTFNSGFSGSKSIYMWAADAGGTNTGWQSRGSWSVPGSASPPPPPPASGPSAVSVTPSSGSGLTQTFTLQYSDSTGASSLAMVWVAFNATANNPAPGSCAVYYSPSTNAIYLENDTATGSSGALLGSFRTFQNSQCTINPAASTVTRNGTILTLNLSVTFSSAYNGVENIYARAVDTVGANTGWQSLGAWTVP